MYANPRNSAQAYSRVGLESDILGANPHRLIVLLYEGAELAIRMAITYIGQGEQKKKIASITKARNIIQDGLHAALDPHAGEISQQLAALYDYMSQRLLLGQLRNDTAPLEEVMGLLASLRDAWQQIGGTAPTPGLQTVAA